MSDMQVDRMNTRDGKLKVRVGDIGRQQEWVISVKVIGSLAKFKCRPKTRVRV